MKLEPVIQPQKKCFRWCQTWTEPILMSKISVANAKHIKNE